MAQKSTYATQILGLACISLIVIKGYLTSRKDYSSPASLIATIDPQEHTQRRRLWEQGFTTASLKGYEDMITKRINQLVTVLETTKGTEMNLAKWLQFFSYALS